MKLKQFMVYSLIYIGLVGILVFVQNGSSFTASIFGIGLTLPVALWFVLPLLLFAILTLLHMAYNGLSLYRRKKAIQSDSALYEVFAKEILLAVETDKKFKTEIYKTAKEVTKFLSPWHENSVEIDNKEIVEIINMLKMLKDGEVVELKKYKLDKQNPIYIKNEFNKLAHDSAYASEILKNGSNLDEKLVKKAHEVLLNTASYLEIKKYQTVITKEDALALINRYENDTNFEMSKEDFYALIVAADYSESEYIQLVKKLRDRLNPEILLAMFDRLKNEKEDAGEAYLYLLYELGMIDQLKEKLAYSDGEENEKFSLLLQLRENGKAIPASYLF
ncbi:hypothetical protein [Campylobacter geochelonis]|uniref:FdhC protein n=1 Tax=Campylobacter geochelonis TaxID=1780362 RepID=A0A128EBX4_9BACT|nr:hypothetical protein [Campylobacter geochelonis]QKF70718.1 putative membrane protein [Campylobacter geochelonis]CZE45728.1 FdhC protein [Campylobacter geochelonis]